MSGHAHFMLSKKCLALAFTIDDSLSHCYTLPHLEGRRQPAPPSNAFALTHTNRETLCRHTDSLIQAMGTLVLKIYIKSGSIYKPFFKILSYFGAQ